LPFPGHPREGPSKNEAAGPKVVVNQQAWCEDPLDGRLDSGRLGRPDERGPPGAAFTPWPGFGRRPYNDPVNWGKVHGRAYGARGRRTPCSAGGRYEDPLPRFCSGPPTRPRRIPNPFTEVLTQQPQKVRPRVPPTGFRETASRGLNSIRNRRATGGDGVGGPQGRGPGDDLRAVLGPAGPKNQPLIVETPW